MIGVLTRDFSIYYDLIKALKERDIPFTSLSFDKKIPKSVKVVLTTAAEADACRFERKVIVGESTENAVSEALRLLKGKSEYTKLAIGIDPGERVGIAAIADNELVDTKSAEPQDVKAIVQTLIETHPAKKRVLRIGNGAKTLRNRIINDLFDMLPIEVVDESETDKDHVKAATEIGLSQGQRLRARYEIAPTHGEVRLVQEESRLQTKTLTISEELATKVAKGELTMAQAIKEQKRRAKT